MLVLAFLIFLCNVLRRSDDLLVLGFFLRGGGDEKD